MPDNITLQRILNRTTPNPFDITENILSFYRLVIELERSKEPDIEQYYDYAIHYKNEKLIIVDFPCNKDFWLAFEKNRDARLTRWPKDLYAGLLIKTGGRAFRLLNMVIAFDDIKAIKIEDELLPVIIANFEVNIKEAEKLELLPEQIEAINNGIKANPTMQGILELLREEIKEDVTIVDKVFLALSSKSIELSQIYSELNSKRLKEGAVSSNLLKAFLDYSLDNNVINSYDVDELIRITDLDKYQRQAVAEALNAKVSVITGPPGTGKTQVIQNILANALLKGKSVLVASKNNKAVDNVKDRFDKIDNTGYFIRFGAKQYFANHTLPELNKLLNEIGNMSGDTSHFNKLSSDYETNVKSIADSKKLLRTLDELRKLVPELQKKKSDKESELNDIEQKHKSLVANKEAAEKDIAPLLSLSETKLNDILSEVRSQKNVISAKFDGPFGFWYNWFYKKKYAMLLLNSIERFPYALKAHISTKNSSTDISDFHTADDMISYCITVSNEASRILNLKKEIEQENRRYNAEKQKKEEELKLVATELSNKQNEFDSLSSREELIRSSIESCRIWIEEHGKQLLSAYIHHYKLTERAVGKANAYKQYIPENIPWQDAPYSDFVSTTHEFIGAFRLCAVTSLSAKNAFPLSTELFDMVIIDEASQCDIASAIPLIMRARQLVVIGDPNQLRHITTVKTAEENEIRKHLNLDNRQYLQYVEKSLWDYCEGLLGKVTDGMSKALMLHAHYRCFPNIIQYSNEAFYGHQLDIKTNVKKLKANPQGIVLVDVRGKQVSDSTNVNEDEAKKAIEIATRTASQYPDATIGIVTPFKHQAERINSLIPAQFADQIDANTVHKYQGDEKDIMVYSLVVTDNSPNSKIRWIDFSVPNLVNVAVTRAKSTLYVVCNVDYIKSHSRETDPLGRLVRFK